jgi:hypothetical protein
LDAAGDWTPTCFEEVPAGDYNISVAIPDGYNPTTNLNYPLKVTAGDTAYIDFGAQPSTKGSNTTTTSTDGQRSPWLAIFGGVLILAGVLMAAYFFRIRKK